MDAQQAGTFDKKAFIAAVKAAIEAKSPKTLKEADNYKKSGKAGEVKGEVKGLVTQGKEGQTKDIETATAAPPDQSKAVPKPVTPMGPEQPGRTRRFPRRVPCPNRRPPNSSTSRPASTRPTRRWRKPRSPMSSSRSPTSRSSSRPSPTRRRRQPTPTPPPVSSASRSSSHHAGQDGRRRGDQGGRRRHAGREGGGAGQTGRRQGQDQVEGRAKRAEVTAKVQAIFAATEADVKKILDGIDPKVEKAFEAGEAVARQDFENSVSAKMSAYKKDRYSGWLGGLRWAKDKFGMPDKVNKFYEAGRELHLKEMDKTISPGGRHRRHRPDRGEEANRQGQGPTSPRMSRACRPICRRWVRRRPRRSTTSSSSSKSDVNSKQEAVVDTLATKYVEARKGLDERIEELQAQNKGLVDKAIGAIKAVINTIRKLASMLMNTLARVASVVGYIIKAPVRFLGNLIDGVKGGINKFKDNFVEHLRKGLMSLAVRGARRGWRRAAGDLRPQGRHQAAGLAVRPDLAQHPRPDRQADRREGDGRGRDRRRHLPEARRRRGRMNVKMDESGVGHDCGLGSAIGDWSDRQAGESGAPGSTRPMMVAPPARGVHPERARGRPSSCFSPRPAGLALPQSCGMICAHTAIMPTNRLMDVSAAASSTKTFSIAGLP